MSLKVVSGITPKQVTQLIKLSKTDPQVKKYTSDSSRFKSIQSFKRWKRKERMIYSLANKKGDLLGIIWFGKEKIPAIKIYKKFGFVEVTNPDKEGKILMVLQGR